MRFGLIVAFAVLCVGGPRVAFAQDGYLQFATSASYLAAGSSIREGYVAGALDTLIALDQAPDWLVPCIGTMRISDIRETFDDWLERNRPQRIFSVPTNLVVALDEACRGTGR